MAAFRPAEHPRVGERGFILIGAIWLLILCGSIAAILTLRSMNSAIAAAGQGEALRIRLAQDAALETVAADLLLGGGKSRWSLLPAEGTIEVDGVRMKVRVTNDLGRIDINEADPKLIEDTLRALGLAAAERRTILQRLLTARDTKQPPGSMTEVRTLLALDDDPQSRCVEEHFTLSSGLAAPHPAHLSPQLAAALGQPAPAGPAAASAGAPLRIEISSRAGASLTVWIKISGLLDRPYSISGFERRRVCG